LYLVCLPDEIDLVDDEQKPIALLKGHGEPYALAEQVQSQLIFLMRLLQVVSYIGGSNVL
jgi:hypothetical protein